MMKGVPTNKSDDGPGPAPPLSWGRAFERLRQGIQWSALGTIINQGSTFIVSVIAARILGRETFGGYAIVLSTIVTLSNIAQLGMGYTTTKFVAELRETDRTRAGRVLGMGTVVSILAACLSAFHDENRGRTADVFYVRITKDLTVDEKRHRYHDAKALFERAKLAHPGMKPQAVKLLLIKERLASMKPHG